MNVEKKNDNKNQIEQMFKSIVPYLTSEALDRLLNVKAAHPDLFAAAVVLIYQNIINGNLSGKIDDESLKMLLRKLSEKKRREPHIKIDRKGDLLAE